MKRPSTKTVARTKVDSGCSVVEARPAAVDGLWAIAMLRVAMELKTPSAAPLSAIVEKVTASMGIPRAPFAEYLAQMGLHDSTT